MTDLREKKKRKNNAESQKNSQLGPTKVAEEKEKRASDNSEATVSDKEKTREKGENLYGMACDYLKNVLTSVKEGKCFLLDPGFQIINEMVALQFFTDTLFLRALRDDAPMNSSLLTLLMSPFMPLKWQNIWVGARIGRWK